MTLSRLLIAALMVVSSFAKADIIKPGRRIIDHGGSNYGPVMPPSNGGGDYGPIMPYPDDRGDDYGPVRPNPYPEDPYNPGYGHRTSEEIYVNRYVRNESIDLMRELYQYSDYRVEAVHVYVERSRVVNASLELLVNGRSEDSRRANIGEIILNPRSLLEIGNRMMSLQVYIRGEMLIDRIVVDLASEGHRPPPYQGREITVPVRLPSYMPPQARLDLTPYIDIRRYQGYEVRGVEITAVARYNNNATIAVLINGFNEGGIYLNRYQTTQTIRSRQNLVIGSSFGNLVLLPRGDSDILQVSLILSR